MSEPALIPPGAERLQRVLAGAGVASRRACEALIEAGHVEVNGRTVRRLPVFVDPARDRIRVNGQPLQPAEQARRLYVMLHKPPRVITSSRDEPGLDRRTVLDLVKHPSGTRLFAVGRLDFEATGLVLLTNDGDLAHRLTHARYGLPKTYRVTVRGGLSGADVPQLEAALTRPARAGEPGRPAPAALRIEKADGERTVFEVTLEEGPNRQLRDVLKRLGMPVKKLERTAMGPLRLTGLAPGQWRELGRDEVKDLKRATRPAERTRAGARAQGGRGVRRSRRAGQGRLRPAKGGGPS